VRAAAVEVYEQGSRFNPVCATIDGAVMAPMLFLRYQARMVLAMHEAFRPFAG